MEVLTHFKIKASMQTPNYFKIYYWSLNQNFKTDVELSSTESLQNS